MLVYQMQKLQPNGRLHQQLIRQLSNIWLFLTLGHSNIALYE